MKTTTIFAATALAGLLATPAAFGVTQAGNEPSVVRAAAQAAVDKDSWQSARRPNHSPRFAGAIINVNLCYHNGLLPPSVGYRAYTCEGQALTPTGWKLALTNWYLRTGGSDRGTVVLGPRVILPKKSVVRVRAAKNYVARQVNADTMQAAFITGWHDAEFSTKCGLLKPKRYICTTTDRVSKKALVSRVALAINGERAGNVTTLEQVPLR